MGHDPQRRSPRGCPISLFLIKRFAAFIATLVAASAVIFALLALLPGSVVEVMLGETASPEAVAALTQKLGLDQPAWQRYLHWVGC